MADKSNKVNSGSLYETLRSGDNSSKWMLSLAMGVLFAVLGSNFAYGLTSQLGTSLGSEPYIKADGGVTTMGLIVHAVVFTLIVRAMLW